MISCALQAGFGNMLFQIASIYSLSLDNNVDFKLDFNNHYLPMQGNNVSKYRDSVFSKIKQTDCAISNSFIEPGFRYSPLPFIDNCLYSGYFQSYKYFHHNRDKIIELFSTLPQFSINYNFTTVHVRRGDYLKYPHIHPVCSEDYYRQAMDLIGDGPFLFVSDDMQWVKERFYGPNISYSIFSDDLLDFRLMAYAKNNIMSNSTFSFWAAYLNKNLDKKIIRPSQWFGQYGHSSEDICPPEWITI